MTISHLKKAPIIKTVRFNFRSVSGSIRRLCTFLHLDNLAENTPHTTAVLSNVFTIHDEILSLCNWILLQLYIHCTLNLAPAQDNHSVWTWILLDTIGGNSSYTRHSWFFLRVPRRLWHRRWSSYCYCLIKHYGVFWPEGEGGAFEANALPYVRPLINNGRVTYY